MALGTIQVGRLLLGAPPTGVTEPVGDGITSLGGAIVPAGRTAPVFTVALATYLNGGTTLAQAQTLRRQLRSLLNNSPLKLQAFLYVVYSDDTEQNGWYAPPTDTLAGVDKAAWKAVGLWQTGGAAWLLAGRKRTYREARSVWMKDLRTGLFQRDTLGWILSTDFSALPALALTELPNGVSQAALTVSGAVVSGPPLPTGRDGGTCQVVQGLVDLAVVAYERPQSAFNLSDVIAYDRRGQLNAPAGGPDPAWEEAYGPDFPWSWAS